MSAINQTAFWNLVHTGTKYPFGSVVYEMASDMVAHVGVDLIRLFNNHASEAEVNNFYASLCSALNNCIMNYKK